MPNIWDDKLGFMERSVLSHYPNIQALFQGMPYDEKDPRSNAMGKKLEDALTNPGLIPSLNRNFAARLDSGLQNEETREKIIRVAHEDPDALDRLLDVAVSNPADLDNAARNVRLASDGGAPASAPPATAPATPPAAAPRATPTPSSATPAPVGSVEALSGNMDDLLDLIKGAAKDKGFQQEHPVLAFLAELFVNLFHLDDAPKAAPAPAGGAPAKPATK
jgi:hypothetical protein